MHPRTLLGLMRLASPALPVGGFSYSEGLEAADEAGLVRDEASAAGWLEQQLELALARSELPLLIEAHRAWSARDRTRIDALHEWHRSTRESAEQRLQAEQMGRSLLDWLRQGPQADDARIAMLSELRPAAGWPIAFALAAVLAGADASTSAIAFAHGWAENMTQASIKAVPLGQAAAQRILDRLSGRIPAAVERALATGDDERRAYAPMLAILSSQHEVQYSRLFRS